MSPDSSSGAPEAASAPVRVRLMGRDFTLRIDPRDEVRTRASVAYVDAKLAAFRAAHPLQNETTAALIVALAIGDELLDARAAAVAATAAGDDTSAHLTDALLALDLHLAAALTPSRPASPTDDAQPDDEWEGDWDEDEERDLDEKEQDDEPEGGA